MSSRLPFQLQLLSLWLPKTTDFGARWFEQKPNPFPGAELTVLHVFCLNTERPQAIDTINLSIAKFWEDLLLCKHQLHGTYSSTVTTPTNADGMNRLYRVQPHTGDRDIRNTYHKAQKPVRQVQFRGVWAAALCPLPTLAPRQLCVCPHPTALNGGQQGLTHRLGGAIWAFPYYCSVVLYMSRYSPLDLRFNSRGFRNTILTCTQGTLKQSKEWSGVFSDSFSPTRESFPLDSSCFQASDSALQ